MDQYLIHITAMRRVEPRELQDVLLHINKAKGDQVWLLGLKGSRTLVEDLNKYTPERWQTFAQHGLVYVVWAQHWAFAADLDEKTQLPVLMRPYEEGFPKQEPAAPAASKQLTLQPQPAEQATTQPS